ncbi:MAG: hypothetical protein IJO20_06285 [Ruminococcus sp.]|nr:hypothetical protein [Ruminococcus sp.]
MLTDEVEVNIRPHKFILVAKTTIEVNIMDDEKMLNLISKNAEMGVVGIDAVRDYASGDKFKKELSAQREEYNKIYKSARNMLLENGCDVSHPSAMAKMSTEMMSRMKTLTDPTDSKIAEMMLQGSAMGVAKVIRNSNEYDGSSREIRDLADKLRETEEYNIENMKRYL